MEAINYAPGGQNMILTEDAQIVPGVSGNACYLPAGVGKIALEGDRNELSVSLWRQWDGIVESDTPRGIFSFKNIQIFFDNMTDLLTVVINGFKAITDIKDDQQQTHWGFTFAKNGLFTVYKNAKEVYALAAGDKPADMTDGFTIGGGRTHATFDEVRVYKTVLKQGEINGLFYLVSKGTQVKQLEKIVQSATPKYLGVIETVPTTRTVVITKGERLGAQDANPGDWVLMAKTVGGWKVGVCYRWTGSMWINLEPEYNYTEQYQAALYHICEIEELMKNTGHFGALFAKVLVAQKALIDELLVNQAFIKNLVVQKLHIDSDTNNPNDFETKINKTDGVLVRNKNRTILHIDPQTGQSAFNGDIKANKIFLNKTNQDEGVIEAVNNGWKLVIQPSPEGIELCIMGGDGGTMKKKQLYTYISGGLMSLAVMGSISCSNLFSSQTTFNSWEKVDIPTTQYYDGTTNIFTHQGRLVLMTNTNEIFTSSLEGVSWEKQNDLLTDERRLVLLNAISVGENIFAAGSENNKTFLFKSKDFGVTWDNTNIEAHAIFSDSEDVFILRYDALYKISANFLNEEKIYESHGTENITNMVLNKKIWIVQTYDRFLSCFRLYFSTDKGKTWHNRARNNYACTIAFGEDFIFMGNVEGLKKSPDNGVTWVTILNEEVRSLFYIDKYLIILSNDENKGGIFVSDNNGDSFSFISCGYSYGFLSMVATPTARIITTDVVGMSGGSRKAVLLVNKNKQYF